MSKSVIGAIALVVLTLSACVAGDAEPSGQESPTQSAEAVPQAVQDKIAQWSRLSDVEIEPFNKDMGLFSGDQVELVSQDVIELAKSQLRADRASSSAEMEQQVKDLAAGAPGKLGESMTDQVELDRKDESEKFWTMPYVQPLDSSLDVVEDSRMSYAWDAKVEPVADGTGVTVTLFTRTAHWVNIDDGARTLIGISSWIALSTVDPEYAGDVRRLCLASLRTCIKRGHLCRSQGQAVRPFTCRRDRQGISRFLYFIRQKRIRRN